MKMGRFCSLVGLVFAASSLSDDEALASHGEKQQQPPATTLPSSGKSSRRKTAPEAADEHKEGGEAPPPASKKSALLGKGKGKMKVSQVVVFQGEEYARALCIYWGIRNGTSVRRTSKGTSGNPSEDSNRAVAKSSTLKTAIGSIRTYVATKRGRKIKILAFEVANTIAKGFNLMKFLSEENIRYLKCVVLQNQGMKRVIANDQNQLLALVGDEIRQQFKDFAADVARLGNMCRDPKWHNLDEHLSGLEYGPITQEYSHVTAASKMEDLMAVAKKTVILFDALHRLGLSEKMYREAKAQDMPLQTFWNAVKIEKGIVQNAKKKALWVKKIGHIVEGLVYIVHFLPSEINCVFYKEHEEDGSVKTNGSPQQTLGPDDLQLHYAKIIIAIQNLAFVASSVPKCGIDSLFHALPNSIRSSLLPKMRNRDCDKRTELQIGTDTRMKLGWLLPMAESTIRLSRHTRMIGECLLTGSLREYDQGKVLKIHTLYHADRMKTEGYIKDMIMDLHLLIKVAKLRVETAFENITSDQSASQVVATSSAITWTGRSAIEFVTID